MILVTAVLVLMFGHGANQLGYNVPYYEEAI